MKIAITRVVRIFAERDLHERIEFLGSAKLGFPDTALCGFAVGCDLINVAREAMLAIGCIQAQRCHTGHCPTRIATQNRWLVRGLDPDHQASAQTVGAPADGQGALHATAANLNR